MPGDPIWRRTRKVRCYHCIWNEPECNYPLLYCSLETGYVERRQGHCRSIQTTSSGGRHLLYHLQSEFTEINKKTSSCWTCIPEKLSFTFNLEEGIYRTYDQFDNNIATVFLFLLDPKNEIVCKSERKGLGYLLEDIWCYTIYMALTFAEINRRNAATKC